MFAGLACAGTFAGTWHVLSSERALVAGTVQLEGRPAPHVELALFRLPLRLSPGPLATARTDARGRFSFRQFGLVPGVSPGEYVATAEWRPPEVLGESIVRGADLLAGSYADPADSPLHVSVGQRERAILSWNLLRCRRPAAP